MPKSMRQKMKLLYIMQILLRDSDENHPISMSDLITRLDALSIKAERKSLYDDIECLREFGIEIELQNGKHGGYYVAEHEFELPELKLLVDAVQSSKFITEKKSKILIEKLGTLTNRFSEMELDREVFVANRVKTMNESIYFNVDAIQSAMAQNKKIAFKYFEFTREKKKQYRHSGAYYSVSPWSLIWDDENYYLVAYDDGSREIRHYRVDKMEKISTKNELRDGREQKDRFDPAMYSRQVFGMFGGESAIVTLRCENSLAGVIFDRFGRELTLRYSDDEHFEADVRVSVSPVFLGWVFGFGGKMRITSPENVVERYVQMLEEQL